jgi:hypothetical protein
VLLTMLSDNEPIDKVAYAKHKSSIHVHCRRSLACVILPVLCVARYVPVCIDTLGVVGRAGTCLDSNERRLSWGAKGEGRALLI